MPACLEDFARIGAVPGGLKEDLADPRAAHPI